MLEQIFTYIIAGTAEGTISAFNMTDTLWRTRVDSIPLSQPPLRHPASGREIRHLLSAHISDPHGDVYNVVLACDENPLIHVLSEGREILQVVVPAKVLAMCTGHFINPRVLQNDSQGDPPSHRHGEQVLISTESGLYVLYDWFKIASYASPISSPVYLKAFSFSSTGTTTSHVLTYTPTSLCLDIYKNGNVVHSIPMESTLIALDLRVGTADLIDVVVSLSDGNVWWWRIEEGVEEGEILE
ncbi:hypothetical protein BC832DRAFT_290683 [Gaertneriomyces semiglobifer]|nr:hypothetical protein BC832DRAFT_290683 [Gaertneriomyces semiglobifer]